MTEDKSPKILIINESKKSGKIYFKISFNGDKEDIVTEEIESGNQSFISVDSINDIVSVHAIIDDKDVEMKKENDLYFFKEGDISLMAAVPPVPPWIGITPYTYSVIVQYISGLRQTVKNGNTLRFKSDNISAMSVNGHAMDRTDAQIPTWVVNLPDAINVTAVVHDGN